MAGKKPITASHWLEYSANSSSTCQGPRWRSVSASGAHQGVRVLVAAGLGAGAAAWAALVRTPSPGMACSTHSAIAPDSSPSKQAPPALPAQPVHGQWPAQQRQGNAG